MTLTKFIHIADLHLGKRQYNNNERYNDYFRALKWILDLAVNEKVDFVLIAGDMFDNSKVTPSVLIEVFYMIRNFKNEAQKQLNREIPLICIEGNHDNRINSKQSWMTFLADLDLIILLSGHFDVNKQTISFEPYDLKNHKGGMIQINNINIYGMPFFGSSTIHLFKPIYDAIERDSSKLNILMMHFGVEGEDSSKAGIKFSENFEKMHEKIDYLALGHYHKLYEVPRNSPWVFNPGSLEITDIKEVLNYFNSETRRGAFLVETVGEKKFQHKVYECEYGDSDPLLIPNRRFFNISRIDISTTNSFEETIDIILDTLTKYGLPPRDSEMKYDPSDLNCPVVFFNITGEINYSRLEVNIHQIRKEVMEKFSVLEVRIFSPYLISNLDEIKFSEEEKTIDEIEKEIFKAMIETNTLFDDVREEVLILMKTLKNELLNKQINFLQLKNNIESWCLQNAKIFKIPTTFSKELEEEIEEERRKTTTIEMADFDDEFDIDLNDYILDAEDDSKEGN